MATAEDFIRAALANATNSADMFDPLETPAQSSSRTRLLLAQFQLVAVMEQLRRVDPQVADSMAGWLSEVLLAGDTVHELLGQWTAELLAGHQLVGVGPRPAEPAAPDDAVLVSLPSLGDPIVGLAVPTSVPGLQVVQASRKTPAGNVAAEGAWVIVHEPSGRLLHARGFYPLDVAQRIVADLGPLLDWTAPGPDVTTQLRGDEALRDRFRAVFVAAEGCCGHTDADHLPLPEFRRAAAGEGISAA